MALNEAMRSHLRKTASSTVLGRSAILRELKSMHVLTEKDDELAKEIDVILAHIDAGNSAEGYALVLSGKSGAGKTTVLDYALDNNPSFAPFEDEHGNEMALCLRLKTPASCSVKTLGKAVLRATGYDLQQYRDEEYIWDKVVKRLKLRQTCIIVLDEFQHVLNAPSGKGYLHLSDTVKNLMQVPGWPVWLILSGVPEIETFIERDPHKQTARRAPVVKVGDIDDDEYGREQIEEVLRAMAETCRCEVAFPLEGEFMRRLMHAGLFRLGMIIQIIKNAMERCMWDDEALKPRENDEAESWYLAPRHFVEGYRRISNCAPDTNVFTAKEWWLIEREPDEDGELVDVSPRAGKKSRKK